MACPFLLYCKLVTCRRVSEAECKWLQSCRKRGSETTSWWGEPIHSPFCEGSRHIKCSWKEGDLSRIGKNSFALLWEELVDINLKRCRTVVRQNLHEAAICLDLDAIKGKKDCPCKLMMHAFYEPACIQTAFKDSSVVAKTESIIQVQPRPQYFTAFCVTIDCRVSLPCLLSHCPETNVGIKKLSWATAWPQSEKPIYCLAILYKRLQKVRLQIGLIKIFSTSASINLHFRQSCTSQASGKVNALSCPLGACLYFAA